MQTLSKLCCITLLLTRAPAALTLEGRLPGDQFKEDNPPRFGALMSFQSRSNAMVALHAVNRGADYAIAQQLARIERGFKLPAGALKKTDRLDGALRWLQYEFLKKPGKGIVYITRSGNTILYLLIYNAKPGALAYDLPYIERYLRVLQVKED